LVLGLNNGYGIRNGRETTGLFVVGAQALAPSVHHGQHVTKSPKELLRLEGGVGEVRIHLSEQCTLLLVQGLLVGYKGILFRHGGRECRVCNVKDRASRSERKVRKTKKEGNRQGIYCIAD
jgi:hypothetical protein